MPLSATLEGSTYELDEVDLTWTLHEFRDALANACGSFKIFDVDEWRIRKGPAPLNLEVPPYEFIEGDSKVKIG